MEDQMEEKLKEFFVKMNDTITEEAAEIGAMADKKTEEKIRQHFCKKTGLRLENTAPKRFRFVRVAAAAVMMIAGISVGTGISYAAYQHFFMKPVEYHHAKGIYVDISKEQNERNKIEDETVQNPAEDSTDHNGKDNITENATENITETIKENTTETAYYLQLQYIPEGYVWDEEGSCYQGEQETDFWDVAFFHLKTKFLNILPSYGETSVWKLSLGKNFEGEAYYVENASQGRLYIRFLEADYLVEIRNWNKKNLSREEITKIAKGALISTEKPEGILYETLEWTEELEQSYEHWLAQVAD